MFLPNAAYQFFSCLLSIILFSEISQLFLHSLANLLLSPSKICLTFCSETCKTYVANMSDIQTPSPLHLCISYPTRILSLQAKGNRLSHFYPWSYTISSLRPCVIIYLFIKVFNVQILIFYYQELLLDFSTEIHENKISKTMFPSNYRLNLFSSLSVPFLERIVMNQFVLVYPLTHDYWKPFSCQALCYAWVFYEKWVRAGTDFMAF